MEWERNRRRMVEFQLRECGIRDERVLEAMFRTPRHRFVQEALGARAYNDSPLPIGEGQTISQPSLVARMTEALGLAGSEKVLDVGTGSGYQTAILAGLARRVYSVERIPSLAWKARTILESLRHYNVSVKVLDGTLGWPENSPYDAILVTAGAPEIPAELIDQLAENGRLVIPMGCEEKQTLFRLTKKRGRVEREELGPCRFVKLIGAKGWPE